MNVKDFPEEWKILFKYDKDGKIETCVDLYEKFNRNPLRYSPIFEFEKKVLERKNLNDNDIEKFKVEYDIIDLSYAILNEEEARSRYNQAYVELHRAKLAAHFLDEGNKQRKEGDLEDAITCYDQVVRLPDARPELVAQAYNNIGEVLDASSAKDNRKKQEAKNQYHAALQNDPNNLDALVNCANIAAREERYEDAKQHYEKALAINSRNKPALQGIIDCLIRENSTFSANLSVCEEGHKNSRVIEKKKKAELDQKGIILQTELDEKNIAIPLINGYVPTSEELELCKKINEHLEEYRIKPSGNHLTEALADASWLVTQFPQNSEAYHYLAILCLKQVETEKLPAIEKEKVLNEALLQINASLSLNNVNSAGWQTRKMVLEHLVKLNTHKIDDLKKQLNNSACLDDAVDEEYNLETVKVSAKEALLMKISEEYKRAKEFVGSVKRHALCGYLPAKDQIKIAKEHGESPKIYTAASMGTEIAAGASILYYGVYSFNPLAIYTGAALLMTSLCQGLTAITSKKQVAGSPLAFWTHIKNYIEGLQMKFSKALPAAEEIKLLGESTPKGFKKFIFAEKKDDGQDQTTDKADKTA